MATLVLHEGENIYDIVIKDDVTGKLRIDEGVLNVIIKKVGNNTEVLKSPFVELD